MPMIFNVVGPSGPTSEAFPETDEAKMHWIARRAVKLPDISMLVQDAHEILGIREYEFVELTNRKAFFEILDKYKNTFIMLPKYSRIKRRQAESAERGNIAAERALYSRIREAPSEHGGILNGATIVQILQRTFAGGPDSSSQGDIGESLESDCFGHLEGGIGKQASAGDRGGDSRGIIADGDCEIVDDDADGVSSSP